MESVGDVYEGDIDATELRLGLPGTNARRKVSEVAPRGHKRAFHGDCKSSSGCTDDLHDLETAPAAKAQVVGWPPVRSFRKNTLQLMKAADPDITGLFMKVSMDGAPYLRKIDLNVYKGYKELRHALDCMFNCFSSGEREDGSEFVIAYEDREGDWMLVGDVPWEMFSSSCKRLRIMKGSDAKGLES